MSKEITRIWLIGAPNSGKTSLFNALTNLNLRTGNYSGITTDIFSATVRIENKNIDITDMPGIFSVFSSSEDEKVVTDLLSTTKPDALYLVSTIETLDKNILIYSQLQNIGFEPYFILLKKDNETNPFELEHLVDIEVNHADSTDLELLKSHFTSNSEFKKDRLFEDDLQALFVQHVQKSTDQQTHRDVYLNTAKRKHYINQLLHKEDYVNQGVILSKKVDRLILNPKTGYLLFFGILFLIFQLLFVVADPLMGYIETLFEYIASTIESTGDSTLISLLTQGIIPGLAGVFVFVPQIFILFFLLSLLEESGYFARAVTLFDKPMSLVGLNGKSVVPIVSGFACAIPAIMSARTIDSKSARLNTIFVTPLVSCSARLPVYIFLIEIVIPNTHILGFSLHGLTLLGLYLLGIIITFVSALVVKFFTKQTSNYTFTLSLPTYRLPSVKLGLKYSLAKTKQFLFSAGKIIFILSILLWFLGSHKLDSETLLAKGELSESIVGSIGKSLEPMIEPLGYDWKIGIALVSSFVAREVFVGTMNTLSEIDSTPFTASLPTGISLLIFYTIALQCLSTVGVVISETKSYKFAIYQLIFMNLMAYVLSCLVYQILTT